MDTTNLAHDDLQTVILQLDQAIFNHNEWYESVLRNLVCHQSYDHRDVEEDAHKKCRFGQWYYQQASSELRKHPGFVAIELEHERVHGRAAGLLKSDAIDNTISILDYENFNNSVVNLRLQLQTLRREMEDLLYNHDTLTRAYSRIGLLTKLRELQNFVKRDVHSCCIAMVDLDHFKLVNDTYGHLAGDQVLRSIAGYVIAKLRAYDQLFRYGGEEFLISMPYTNSQSGLLVAERLRKGIAATCTPYEGNDICITASFGLTLLDADVPVEQTIERADNALYAAKRAGRNCTQIWDPSLDKQTAQSEHQ